MHAVVENLSPLARKIKVSVPSNQVSDEVNKRIKKIAKEVKIKGFRPGKVPDSVVRTQFGASVRNEVMQDLVWKTLEEVLKEKNIYPVNQPNIEVTNVKEGEPLEYEASFEIRPDVHLKDVEGITVEKPEVSIDKKHIIDVIEKLRKQNVKWKDVERAADEGDLVEIDFEGFIDDKPFDGGKAKNFKIELGSKRMIPGFEDQLINSSAGDEVKINVTFPKDYHAEDLANKEATFVVRVHKVQEAELPELNDAFAKDLGVTEGTVDALESEVKLNLERELQRRIRNAVKDQIIEQLLAKNTFEVPQSLVENEITRIQNQMKKQWEMQTGQKNVPDLPKEQFAEQARKNVTLGLLLSQWVQDHKIKVDGVKVREKIEEIASGYHRPADIVNMYYGNKEALADIEAVVLEEQALDSILEKAKVVMKPKTYEEIMNPNNEGEE